MARTLQLYNSNNLEKHQLRMAMISQTIIAIALKKQQACNVFQKGDQVEVASQVDGFIGSYFTATIISPIDNYKYKVKYKNLLTEDMSDFLEEDVTASEVRPVPPEQRKLPEHCFRLYDKVDAFDNDGWWIGFISKIDGSKYYVNFPTTGHIVAYFYEDLRFHQEWFNGKWTRI